MNRLLSLAAPRRLLSFGLLLLTALGLQGCLKENVEATNCAGTTYVHMAPISIGFQAIITGLNLVNANGNIKFLYQDSTAKEVIMAKPPTSFTDKYLVDTTIINRRQVLTLTPKTGATGRHILYIHGGGFGVNIGEDTYDNFYAQIMERTGATITLPDYGLAPYHTYKEAYLLFQATYDALAARVGAGKIIVMGESAGGNLALGFTQKLKLENRPLPAQTIVFFPLLDATLANPAINNIQDPILNADRAREATTAWAGGTDRSFYQLSPLNGPLEGLPPLSVFSSGRDLTQPDCLKLRDMMNAKCLALSFYEYPQMIHGWMGLFTNAPESKHAWAQIATLVHK